MNKTYKNSDKKAKRRTKRAGVSSFKVPYRISGSESALAHRNSILQKENKLSTKSKTKKGLKAEDVISLKNKKRESMPKINKDLYDSLKSLSQFQKDLKLPKNKLIKLTLSAIKELDKSM